MTRTTLLCASLAALAALGCSGTSPTTDGQSPSADGQSLTWQAPPLGIYHLAGNAADGLSLSPAARVQQALGDNFSVDITSIAGPNFRLSGIEFLADDSLKATFTFKHPLPDTTGRKDLHVFDLRMHVMSPSAGAAFTGAEGINAPTGASGAGEAVRMSATGLTNADGWSTWGDEIVEPAVGDLTPNLYPYKLVHEDTGRTPLNADAPAGWNVVPQSATAYTVAAIFQLDPGQSVDLFIALDASYGNSAVGQALIAKPDLGGRLNPKYLNPEFNIKEAWKSTVNASGTVTAGVAGSSAAIQMSILDHQGNLPAAGAFDPLTSPSTSLRYASGIKEVVISVPSAVSNAIILPGDSFTGEGTPASPFTRNYALTGDMVSGSATAGTHLGLVAIRDEMVDTAAATAPLPTKGYTRANQVVTRYDFTTYQTFTLTVAVDGNQAPSADVAVNPATVTVGGTVQLSPGPGTDDPDGSITLYEYDFSYTGTFTADTSNTSGAAVTSPAQNTAGTKQMAMRVTDNGTPGKSAIDTVNVIVEASANQAPTADVSVSTTSIESGGTVQLSSGPGSSDPDGTITLYEFDFDYVSSFTADTSNTTGAPVTSPTITNPGAGPITRLMAMRVTDDGTPGLTGIDTITITIQPAVSAPTWTQVHNLIVNGDPSQEFSDCVSCHASGQGDLTLTINKNVTYANLVGVASVCDGTPQVAPNNAAGSLLYKKLTATPGCGTRMPRGGPYWSPASMQMVADWINAGAQNN